MKRINVYTVELIKESAKLYELESAVVKSPGDAYAIIETVLNLSSKTKEHLGILTLNTKNKVAGVHVVSIGSLNASIVHAREVFQQAILNNAASIILFHNHPSGVVSPSPEDAAVTERLKAAGEIIGIDVIDHLIIGDNDFYSFAQNGNM